MMIRAVCTAVALCVVVACGGKSGGSSPEAVFENAKSAVAGKDWKGLFKTVDPQKSEMMIFGVTMGAAFLTMDNDAAKKELDQIGKNHGVETDPKAVKSTKGDPESAAKEGVKNVKDKAALFADIMNFIEKHAKDQKMFEKDFAGATIKNVKIEGDNATGDVTKADGKTKPMKFIKREGAWYLAMDRE